jgi:hypothetical protein
MKWYNVRTIFFAICAVLVTLGTIAALVLSPTRAVGQERPGTIIIKNLEDQYGPVTFDHEMHTAMADGCGTCHHQHNEKIRTSCKECHEMKVSGDPSFIACSSCHSDTLPDMPEMPGLKVALHSKCFPCHMDMGIGELGSSPGACVKTCHSKK